MREAPAGLHRVLARDARHIVEDLKIALVRDERLIPVGAEIYRTVTAVCRRREDDLAHRGRRVAEVDAWNADLLRRVLQVVHGRHEELDRAPAEAEFVQPARTERMRVVERQPLRL